jgi:hypothetical protein
MPRGQVAEQLKRSVMRAAIEGIGQVRLDHENFQLNLLQSCKYAAVNP